LHPLAKLSLWFLACAAGWGGELIQSLHVAVPMRDGVRLAANVFRPLQPARVPTLLYRTPNSKGGRVIPNYTFLVDRGYAVVVQDVRGRYESGGAFRPLEQEGPDGYDTIEWIARQPWSDGQVGMIGASYLGIVQWKAALLQNRHLKAISPAVSGWDDYVDRFYSAGGAMKLGNRLLWMSEQLRTPGFMPDFSRFVLHLPLRSADIASTGQTSEMYRKAIAHPAYDDFWRRISTREQIEKIRIPVFSAGGWYDNFAPSDLEAFAALQKAAPDIPHRILIGPWPHDFGPEARTTLLHLQADWFDRWLKDAPAPQTPPVRIFVMGANRWRDEGEWPPARLRYTPMYLQADGGLAAIQPAADVSPDHYSYDPHDPAPTRGGPVCCRPAKFPWGAMDQREVENRADVLSYSSEPLPADRELTGPVRAVLYVSTSARDTDFTVKFVDVFPDGQAINLTDGILRLRYRQGLDRAVLAQPNEIYKIGVDAGVTSNLFRQGHRIRVEISSSNFPRFDRNPNTGGPIAAETKLLKAVQTVYHDRQHPSHIVLPVIP
jgi:uncharacterized protein